MEKKQIFLNVQRKQAERLLNRYSEHNEPRSDDQFIPVSFSILDNPGFRNGLMTKKRFRTYLWLGRHVVRGQKYNDPCGLFPNYWMNGKLAVSMKLEKIAKDLGLSKSTVSDHIRQLENDGIIARHLKAMMDDFGYTQSELELKGYGSKARISGLTALLELPESVQTQIQEGELTAAHGRALAKLTAKKEQERMAKQIIDGDMTAKRAEIRIDRYLKKGKREPAETKQPMPTQDIPGVYIKDSRDMSELPNKSVHMVLSSPPYNVGVEFEKGIPFDEHLEMVKDVLKECARVLVPGGVIALNVDDILNFKGRKGKSDLTQIQLMGHIYQSYLRKHNILLTDMIIWKKQTAWLKKQHLAYSDKLVHTTYRIFDNFEPVYIFRKKGERDLPSEDVILRSKLTKQEYIAWVPSVWDINTVHKMEGHPCIWPDELAQRLIRMFTYEGDTPCQHDLRNTEKILKSLPNIDVEESLNLYLELGGFCDCEILFNVEEGWKKN